MQRFDVAVIGAGPAGSAAAICLARKGYTVTLIDKKQFPREKLCGDFFNPVNWPVFRELGVENAILDQPHEKISMVRVTVPSGAQAIAPISQNNDRIFGLGISRDRLDYLLLQTALSVGVAVRQRCRVRRLVRETSGWRIDAGGENDIETVRATILIGADGRNSRIAHQLGWTVNETGGAGAVGLQFRLREPELARNSIEIHIFSGGYAGLVRLGDGRANLCLAMARHRMPATPPSEWRSSLGLSDNPFLRDLVSRAQFSTETRSAFPVYFPPRRSFAERVLLVGDAARVAEPATGEGIYFAARSALIAAETIDEAFQRRDFSWRRLSSYERRCRREFRKRRALNRLLQYLIYRPRLAEALIRFSSRRQRLLNSIVETVCVSERPEISTIT